MKNLKERIQNNKGITLVALVVTIIVLLILAGVSISAVFSQQGIFNRAENAIDKHSQSKARETLDMLFSEAQMKKYDEGLTDDELNKMIEVVGQLLPKDDPESKYQLVIVDGYIFEIDRSVPKVVEYKGPADGIIITATISGNNGWVKPEESITVKGSIKIYGEGSIASSSATSTNSSVSLAGFPTKGGDFTINNITADTDIKITATDSTGKTYEKTIQVVIKRDTTPPTITEVKAEAEGLKIKISATGHDKNSEGIEESGIKQFKYIITSTQDTTLAGIPADKREGTFTTEKPAEITTTATGNREETTYTISVTAIDNCNNTSAPTTKEVTTKDILTLEDLKKITPSNYSEYIGKKVDYNPTGKGTWRAFYIEDSNNTFGDGEGTVYLKRDYEKQNTLTEYVKKEITENGLEMMKKLNPYWREYTKNGVKNGNKTASDTFLDNEKVVSELCDTTKWTKYATGDQNVEKAGLTIKYAIGGAPVEMWCKAQNTYKNKPGITGPKISCGIKDENGYGYIIDQGSLVGWQKVTLDTSKEESKVLYDQHVSHWLASPGNGDSGQVCLVGGTLENDDTGVRTCHYTQSALQGGICPIVSVIPSN